MQPPGEISYKGQAFLVPAPTGASAAYQSSLRYCSMATLMSPHKICKQRIFVPANLTLIDK